jgi:hypothetical protein
MKENKEVFKKALDDVFGCCSAFDTGRDGINDKPREVKVTVNLKHPENSPEGRRKSAAVITI